MADAGNQQGTRSGTRQGDSWFTARRGYFKQHGNNKQLPAAMETAIALHSHASSSDVEKIAESSHTNKDNPAAPVCRRHHRRNNRVRLTTSDVGMIDGRALGM